MFEANQHMKVLMLTSEYPPRIGGVATHVAELAVALRALEVDLRVVAPPFTGAAEYDAARMNQPVVRYAPWLRAHPFYTYLLQRWCRAYRDKYPFDLVHVHGLRPLPCALKMGVPVVFTNHTSGFLQTVAAGGRRLSKLSQLLAKVSHVIAPSEELLSAARTAGYQGPGSYVPNGVDVTRFAPGPGAHIRERWGLDSSHIVIVIARRLVKKNGVMIAGHALSACVPTVRFVFAGDGPERVALEALLTATGARGRAIFLGSVQNTEMPEIYRAADICLLPSLMEATSIAGLEAMASGKALIGTRVGGIPALIKDGVTGLLVPPNDPAAISAAVNKMAKDRQQLERMGAAARIRAEHEFAWPKIATRTQTIYRETLTEAKQVFSGAQP
jgi:glycosyltransferase involved in cell wall biosynthesis